jgi:transcriptional regulator with XRE-family HTH domain
MALFFDSAWFDARLEATGLSRADLASALGLTRQQIDEMWKDQRELKASDVRIIAVLLDASHAEIAERAGISTPVPKNVPADKADILDCLERIENILGEIRADIQALKKAGR